MSTTNSDPILKTLTQTFDQVRSRLSQMDCEAIARQSGFLVRKMIVPRSVVKVEIEGISLQEIFVA